MRRRKTTKITEQRFPRVIYWHFEHPLNVIEGEQVNLDLKKGIAKVVKAGSDEGDIYFNCTRPGEMVTARGVSLS